MERGRAYRRAQRARARSRATYIVDRIWRFNENRFAHGADREVWRVQLICQLTTTRKPCSCEGCGNQRRWYGDSIRERLFKLDSLNPEMYTWDETED